MEKDPAAFRTISELAEELGLPAHVLRFWESRFSQIRPLKRTGGRRYYRPEDAALIDAIKTLLYDHGYTIKGVQRLLKENGARGAIARARALPLQNDGESGALAPASAMNENFEGEADSATGAPPHAIHQSPIAANEETLQAALENLSECIRILRYAKNA